MSDWMALWTRMNTFSAITLQMCYRYRQSRAHLTIPVRSRPISRPLQDGSDSNQGRPTRGGYRLLGSSLAPKQLHLKTGRLRATFCFWCGKIAVREGSESGDVGGGKVLIAFPYRR